MSPTQFPDEATAPFQQRTEVPSLSEMWRKTGQFFGEAFPQATHEHRRVSGPVQHHLRVALCLPKSGHTDYL